MHHTIILKNLKNEVMNVVIDSDSDNKYYVRQLKNDICKLTNDVLDNIDIRVIFDGNVLQDDDNIVTPEILGRSLVYLKKPKKMQKEKILENTQPSMNDLARYVCSVSAGFVLSNPNILSAIVSNYGDGTSSLTMTDLVNEITNIIGMTPINPTYLSATLYNNNDVDDVASNGSSLVDTDEYEENNAPDAPDMPLNERNRLQDIDDELDVDSLTDSDRVNVATIVSLGYSMYEAVQMYLACNKDLALALENLLSN